jgi:hypothetical protein
VGAVCSFTPHLQLLRPSMTSYSSIARHATIHATIAQHFLLNYLFENKYFIPFNFQLSTQLITFNTQLITFKHHLSSNH